MKNFKIVIIFFLTLLFIPANAKDKFIGKWINENTKSVFEIVKEENQYKMYIIYSGRFFKEFQNELDGIFMKKMFHIRAHLHLLIVIIMSLMLKLHIKLEKVS